MLTVSVNVCLQGGAERFAVVHEPPVEFGKLVHVPLCGENVASAGPFDIVQLSVVEVLYGTSPGLADSVHVGAFAEILTVYVPLTV